MEKRIASLLSMLLLFVSMAVAQTKVTGTVVSHEDGEPVIGASVKVEGANTGSITDINGNFTIAVPNGKKIVVSYIGMVSQTLKAREAHRIYQCHRREDCRHRGRGD